MSSVARVCSVDDCGRKVYARRVCNPHYQRLMAGASLEPPLRRFDPERGCSAPGCTRPHGQNGLCQAHNKQSKAGREFTPIRTRGQFAVCLVSGCNGKCVSLGMCSKHDKACRNYNLSIIQYQAIRDMGCRICNFVVDRIHVDHDHACCAGSTSCGECVRGGLCPTCNVGLGMFQDSPELLNSAIRYLSGNT